MRDIIDTLTQIQEQAPDFSNLPKPPLDVVLAAHVRAMERLFSKLEVEAQRLNCEGILDTRTWRTIQAMHDDLKNHIEE